MSTPTASDFIDGDEPSWGPPDWEAEPDRETEPDWGPEPGWEPAPEPDHPTEPELAPSPQAPESPLICTIWPSGRDDAGTQVEVTFAELVGLLTINDGNADGKRLSLGTHRDGLLSDRAWRSATGLVLEYPPQASEATVTMTWGQVQHLRRWIKDDEGEGGHWQVVAPFATPMSNVLDFASLLCLLQSSTGGAGSTGGYFTSTMDLGPASDPSQVMEVADKPRMDAGLMLVQLRTAAASGQLTKWNIVEACRRLVARAHPAGGSPVCFPWPGSPEEWPPPGDGTTPLAPGAALPGAEGVRRENWRPVWRLVGPLGPDRLTVVVGPTGRGKTGFAVQVAEAVASAGWPVIYLSAELAVEEVAARILALRAGGRVAWRDFLRGHVPRPELELACAALVADCRTLYLCAPPPGERTATRLRELAEVAATRHGCPAQVMVDYVQRLEGPPERRLDRRQEVSNISGTLRSISQPDGNYPGAGILCLSSTARSNYSKSESALRGFLPLWEAASTDIDSLVGLGKESGELEHDASLVLVLTCDRAGDPEEEAAARDESDVNYASGGSPAPGARRGALAAAKVRDGRTGIVRLDFDPARGCWGNAQRLNYWRGRETRPPSRWKP